MDRATKIILYLVGLALVIAGIFVLFTQTPLADYIPVGVVFAVVLLVLGLGVMIMGTSVLPTATVVDRYAYDRPYAAPAPRTYSREVVYQDDRPREPF